jgi:hypothetical protein
VDAKFVPEGNDDELRILGSVLDVVRDDGHVPEVQRCIDLVHEVQRGGLDEEREHDFSSSECKLELWLAYLIGVKSEHQRKRA